MFTGPYRLQRLAVESTFSTVQESYVTSALVGNVTRGPVRVKHDLYFGKGLAYDQKVLLTALESPTACVSAVKSSTDIEMRQDPTLRSLVNVADYLNHLLLDLLVEHHDMIALPESLSFSTHSEFAQVLEETS
ncbi:hypothetical protein E2C01_039811 [Portunus trituberculatus]|uniref:Uncharacterized protein n=1 Tax=Portunus trituberculatus TaxID=210409 RepID=A0A5B7FHY6_PORTR|nr:hypothetical protein [Portunus trituberculatus]